MVKAIALNMVHVCLEPGERNDQGKVTKRAKIEAMPPGKIFDCSDEDFAAFKASGAVRVATRADIAAADPDGQVELEPATPVEISDKMTKEELLAIAAERGIDVDPSKTKAEIIAAINQPAN